MDHHHQLQDIQLARCSSPQQGSASAAKAAANGDSRRLEMCPALYLAAYKGRVEEVMALLVQPRHGAAKGDLEQVNGTVQHGQCDLHEVSAERNTLLHVTAEQGHGELIEELYHRFIKDKTFLSRRNSALDTPLHCAARAGHLSAVKALLNLSWDSGESIVNCKNEAGDTALHLAARHGHGATMEALVAARASASEVNRAGLSPLYLAVISKSVPAVRVIITLCGDVLSIGPSSQNALHAAVFQSLEMVQLLLQWKPALASQVDCNGSTPLHFAASDGKHSIVSAILLAAPPNTAYMKDSCGLSALHVAARLGHADVVKELIGVCPDASKLRDSHGGNFLHAAVREKRSSVVSLAIKNPMLGGLLNAQDGHGNTPLHLAVAAGAPRIVDALLRKGKVQTDVLNDDGLMPLDIVSKSTSLFTMISLVVTLVAFGAHGWPQRLDHLKPWSSHDIARGIENTSDSLAVVAVLIATVAFAAGFNMPGGYENSGKTNLEGMLAFKCFMFLDTFAMVASVIAVFLLVYGKVSRSAGLQKSFIAALYFIWFSLVSLLLAFYAAFCAVTTSKVVFFVFMAIYFCLYALTILIGSWVGPSTTLCTVWRFVWSGNRSNAVKMQYPYAGMSVYNSLLFSIIVNVIVFLGVGALSNLDGSRRSGRHPVTNILPAPAPMPI